MKKSNNGDIDYRQISMFEEQPPLNSDNKEMGEVEYMSCNSVDVGLMTNEIYCGDTVKTMEEIDDNSINLILTSPPYLASIRKDNHKYPGASDQIKDNQTIKDYLDWMIEIFTQYERIFKKGWCFSF